MNRTTYGLSEYGACEYGGYEIDIKIISTVLPIQSVPKVSSIVPSAKVSLVLLSHKGLSIQQTSKAKAKISKGKGEAQR